MFAQQKQRFAARHAAASLITLVTLTAGSSTVADEIQWVPVPGARRAVSARSADGRKTYGPVVGRTTQGLPTRDTGGSARTSTPQTPAPNRPWVPLTPDVRPTNSTGGSTDVVDTMDRATTAIMDAIRNGNWGNGPQGDSRTGTRRPPARPNGGRSSSTAETLFQVLNAQRTGSRTSASPFPPGPRIVPRPDRSGRSHGPIRLGIAVRQQAGGGLLVTQVQAGGHGQRLGLEPGDVILQANSQWCRTADDLIAAINHPFGARLLIRNVRDGRNYSVGFDVAGAGR